MTVAAALRASGEWTLEHRRSFDDETWWYRARLPDVAEGDRLHLEGLATLAEVFVDGRSVLLSDNMYHAHVVDLPAGARVLTIRFAPLAAALAQKRPRPRWKTRLTSHQQLRWIRTSLVGRMPGWSPPVAPVGPWRDVWVERRSRRAPEPLRLDRDTEHDFAEASLTEPDLSSGSISLTTGELPAVREAASDALTRRLAPGELTSALAQPASPHRVQLRVRLASTSELELANAAVQTGFVDVDADLSARLPFERATLVVGDVRARLQVEDGHVRGRVELPDVDCWWPHTHGRPARYAARLEIDDEVIDLGKVAFRTVALDVADKRFTLSVNGVPVFCRGACWTTLDVATLRSAPEEYRRVLATVRDAGMNMLRVCGPLFYEDDAFYETCDELGILVWQDFMFANMDYPDDEAFRASVEREARQLVQRLRARACVALFCGGSEVEQQAAMFGAPREIWRSTLFSELLPRVVSEERPDVPYWPSSPAGGALPFHVDEGAAHYYGVGAYLRPFDDARRSGVKFASECLAFANVPEDDLLASLLRDGEAPIVSQRWRERTCKDNGAGWDFDDVRDHYVARLFGVDPARVRYEDMERYLALSRVASGESMARALAEWRRPGSTCMGALVWFLQDLWPGAGWGVLDARGEPKSVYWYLKRAFAPRALFVTDEGLNGLHLHVVNDGEAELRARLSLALYRDGETRTADGAQEIVVAPRSSVTVLGDALLPTFHDTTHAYRFGPPGHDVAIATLADDTAVLAEVASLVDFAKPPPCAGLEGTLSETHVTVTTRRFAQAVKIAVPGHVAEDSYFDLAPGRTRTIALRPIPGAKKRATLTGELSALNLRGTVSLK
ncbi:MAG: glycoside hydrolase family 2 protein [Labilithrix sp.]|nr:glycoside hydrolase family 2 protein [Labilithrix sp.]MCW5811239.1 glycoside hydrolase family 2 protein [Labilithrix sp.]